MRQLTEPESGDLTLVATHGREAVALVEVFADGPGAEIAVVVTDRWQRRGLGTQATRVALGRYAERHGATPVTAYLRPDNHRAIALFQRVRDGSDPMSWTLRPELSRSAATL